MAIWSFSSRQNAMKLLLMGIGYKPLQIINYHDSRAHNYEWSEIHVGLVGFWNGLD
jgi:hypothetical protein